MPAFRPCPPFPPAPWHRAARRRAGPSRRWTTLIEVATLTWLKDGTETSVRSALAVVAPELAGLPIRINASHPASNPLWWSSTAVVDGRFVVKFAWSEVRATRLCREGVVLQRLAASVPALPLPEVLAVGRAPALVVTRLVQGMPLGWAWGHSLLGEETTIVAGELGRFLAVLHRVDVDDVIGDLPVVEPTPQADTTTVRDRFPLLVDGRRASSVQRWRDWVDGVLGPVRSVHTPVLVHGDLHGHNQIWDRGSSTLLAVVDFEESGGGDPHYDLRYLPSNADDLELTLAVMEAYERAGGQSLSIDRVMAWHVRTALGDALWRTEAGISLPGGGTAATYVDELSMRLASLDLV